MIHRRHAALSDQKLLPFLPMVAIAWSDGELGSDEISLLCRRLHETVGEDSEALGAWLDPEDPPTAAELAGLLRVVRDRTRELSPADRIDLARLGQAVASSHDRILSDRELAALEALDRALGLSGDEAVQQLLGGGRPLASIEVDSPSFELRPLAELLDAPCADLRRELRTLLASPPFALDRRPALREHRRRWVLGRCQELAAAGYGALSFPTEHGGGGNAMAFFAVFETLAHYELSVLIKFGVQFGLFGGAVQRLGSEVHHRHLRAIASLEIPGCFAMTETRHGSNVAEITTRAVWNRQTGGFTLSTPDPAARKDYIGNAACHGRMAVVFAQLEIDATDYGVHAFLVTIRDPDGEVVPGIAIADCGAKVGLEGVDNGRIAFAGLELPRQALLDHFAQVDEKGRYSSEISSPNRRFFEMLGTLVGGRVGIAGASLAVAKSGLTTAVRYGLRRRQFGAAGRAETLLLDYQSHQLRLLPRLAESYALHAALRGLAELHVSEPDGDERRDLEIRAAALKARASRFAVDTVQVCRESCGGQGYLAENRLGELRADADIFTTFEGDNTVLRLLVAKGRLTGLKRQLRGLGGLGLLRYVAGIAAREAIAHNPLQTRRHDEEHLSDAEVQLGALRSREEQLLRSLGARIKHRLDDGSSPFEAFTQVQDHALALADAWTDAVVLAAMIDWIDKAPPELRPVLDRLRRLAGLQLIWHRRAWYLEHDLMSASKTRAIRDLRIELCSSLRGDALALVEAFRIPDHQLGPIAQA